MSVCEVEMLRETVNKACEKCTSCDKCPFESVCVSMAIHQTDEETLRKCWEIVINL